MGAYVDSWGYASRYCTSWVAWALHDRNQFQMPRAIGDAMNWGVWAGGNGYVVDKTPHAGAVAWWSSGNHVAWVKSVNSNGTVIIEDYNSNYDGRYALRTISASSPTGYIHFKDLSGGGGGWNGVGNATFKGGDALRNGERLQSGEYLVSEDGRFVLIMQTDGNLVIYGPGRRAYWSSNTAGNPGAYLGVQSDGNIVIYAGGRARWTTDTNNAQRLVMQSDGNLVARNSSNQARWASNTNQPNSTNVFAGGDRVTNGQRLGANRYIRSSDKMFYALMQSDGNFVLYQPGYLTYWSSGTAGNSGAYLGVQSDGNIVIYAGGRARWTTDTSNAQRLIIQTDGNLVARNSSGSAVWASNTVRR